MRTLNLPSLVLSVLLQCLPFVRVMTAEAISGVSPIVAILRLFAGATAVAGSFHAVSGASLTLVNPPGGKVTVTNGLDAAFRVSLTYTKGGSVKNPTRYTAANLPAGLKQPALSGTIWRITGIPTQSGVYSNVKLTGYEGGDQGTVTFTITVVDAPPAITAGPKALTVNAGDPVTLSVTATGSSLKYQWLKDDLEIVGATNALWNLDKAVASDSGNYRVRVYNTGSSVLSDPALLTVNTPQNPPAFVSTPVGKVVHEGDICTLACSCQSSGSSPLQFVWTKDGKVIPDAASETLTLSRVSASDAGSYMVTVSNTDGQVSSAPAVVTVVAPLAAQTPILNNNGIRIPFNGIPGSTYVLEGSELVDPPQWISLKEQTAGDFAPNAFDLTDLTATGLYLRVRSR